ncbi:MAG: hypothetical protein ACP5XB_24925, partial [Isosphaeraceae bacterium]
MTGVSGNGEAGGEEEEITAPTIAGRRKVTVALMVAMMVTAMEQLVGVMSGCGNTAPRPWLSH